MNDIDEFRGLRQGILQVAKPNALSVIAIDVSVVERVSRKLGNAGDSLFLAETVAASITYSVSLSRGVTKSRLDILLSSLNFLKKWHRFCNKPETIIKSFPDPAYRNGCKIGGKIKFINANKGRVMTMKSISRLLIILACSGLAGLPQAAWSQAASNHRPTARYARGENVDLALIIAEWRKPYPDVPIYTCICQTETCNETERWPFRTFERYQSLVALGPYNGSYTETRGFHCFNIETGERPQSTP